jgi:hypothetical protein
MTSAIVADSFCATMIAAWNHGICADHRPASERELP